jgi:diguanylate cyclase (GGDEF)-like protein
MHMAYHDPLTDLPNRTKLINQIEHEIHHVKRHGGRLATIFIDIDHFKHINDTYGHLIGDEVLCAIADRLTDCVREEDTVSRIGGDEFVILVSNVRTLDAVSTVVDKLKKLFEQRVALSNGEQLRLTGSMGVSVYPEDGQQSETLLRNADTAMYRAKNSGRNNHAFYTQALTDESVFQLRLQGAIHEALEKNAFYLVYQPQFRVSDKTSRLAGFEALIRWQHESLGAISPLEFIPVAEKLGLIHEIGYWVLESACRQGVAWLKQGCDLGHIAVNVAGPQLERTDFVTKVMAILHNTGFPADKLELEVTESSMMHNSEEAIKHLQELKEYGVTIAIDDFGTGYSSLSYLQKLPLDKIKIDRSFINGLPDDEHNRAIVDAVVALGRALNLSVIAEGVETEEQLCSLKARGCLQVQGYLLGRPVESQDAQALLVDSADSAG